MHTTVVSLFKELVILEIYFRKKPNNFIIQISAELKKNEYTLTDGILFLYLLIEFVCLFSGVFFCKKV